jgi:LPS-assembly protein
LLPLGQVWAASITDGKLGLDDAPDIPWHIAADELSYDDPSQKYVAEGNVVISKQDKKLTADYVLFDHLNLTAQAKGNVVLAVGGDILRAERLDIDLKTETGTIHNGAVFLKENHFYIKGETIEKVGKQTYKAYKASLTSCDGDKPAWIITGRNVDVTIEGYATLKHGVFYARRLPLLYTPYMIVPIKTKRQTGFLLPRLGYSDRNGWQYGQPFFWAINDHSDATLFLHYIQERGLRGGAEFRYMVTDETRGAAMFDYLNDQQVDDGTPEASEQWGFTGDDYPRPDKDRYWFRMKHDQELPFGFNGLLDIDWVSDQDYLTEFKDNIGGFNDTENYFFRTYGRGLDDYNDQTRTNEVQISKVWSAFDFNAAAIWNDNVTARKFEDTNDTLQRLPLITFNGAKQQILESPIYFDLTSSYNYFYREDGDKGGRLYVYPRAYLPLRVKNYFSIEPSVGFSETVYHMNWDDTALGSNPDSEDPDSDPTPGPDRDSDTFHREIYDFKVDLVTEFYRVFDTKTKNFERMKHVIVPKVTYRYIPDIDQDDLPEFTGIDRIGEENLITYSLTNTVVGKSKSRVKAGTRRDSESGPPVDDYNYRRLFRFYLEQSYDIVEEGEEDGEPFTPIYAELFFSPYNWFFLQADARWDVYDGDFIDHNIAGRITDRRGDSLFVEHRFRRDSSETIYSDLLLNLTHNFWGYAEYERDLENSENVLIGGGLKYTASCWSLAVGYKDEEQEEKIFFEISLRGIGQLGQRYVGREVKNFWGDD